MSFAEQAASGIAAETPVAAIGVSRAGLLTDSVGAELLAATAVAFVALHGEEMITGLADSIVAAMAHGAIALLSASISAVAICANRRISFFCSTSTDVATIARSKSETSLEGAATTVLAQVARTAIIAGGVRVTSHFSATRGDVRTVTTSTCIASIAMLKHLPWLILAFITVIADRALAAGFASRRGPETDHRTIGKAGASDQRIDLAREEFGTGRISGTTSLWFTSLEFRITLLSFWASEISSTREFHHAD